jgi:hypothetical protein
MALLPSLAGVAVLLVVWFAGRAENPGPLGFRLDDAWIHQVYARGLLADGYLAYNEGVPATGSTSPLWSACLALLRALSPGAPSPEAVVVGATLAGALLHLVAVGVGAALARRISGDRLTALVPTSPDGRACGSRWPASPGPSPVSSPSSCSRRSLAAPRQRPGDAC